MPVKKFFFTEKKTFKMISANYEVLQAIISLFFSNTTEHIILLLPLLPISTEIFHWLSIVFKYNTINTAVSKISNKL